MKAPDLLQREVLVVQLEDEVEVGGGVPAPDIVGDGVPVVPDPLEVNRRLPLRPHDATTSSTRAAAAACSQKPSLYVWLRMNQRIKAKALTFGVGLNGGRGGGGGGGEEAGMGPAEQGAGEGPERGEGGGGCGRGGGEEAAAGQHIAGEVEVAGG